MKKCWTIPPAANAAFAAAMEDVLAVYRRPLDPTRPYRQLLAERGHEDEAGGVVLRSAFPAPSAAGAARWGFTLRTVVSLYESPGRAWRVNP